MLATRICFFTILLVVFAGFFMNVHTAHASGQNYTVCSSGCDFVTLTDALQSPGLGNDTVTLTSDYVFNPLSETTNPYLPVGVTLTCDAGADTIGDSSATQLNWNIDSDSVIEHCTFDNNRMESSTKTHITIRNNTFVGTASSQLFINATDTFMISNNVGLQEITIGASDNGVIDGNQLECYQNNSCFKIVGYGPITDYSDPAQIANNIQFTNNIVTNHTTNGNNDWIYIGNGDDIVISDNTIKSAVTIDNMYMLLITVQSTLDVTIEHNTIVMPEKTAPADQGTWAINVRADSEILGVTINNNTIIYNSQPSSSNSCLGQVNNSGHAPVPLTINYHYNICYNGSTTATGSGITLNYDLSENQLTFNESYNGYYGLQSNITDNNNNIITSIDTTSITTDPIFRTENIDTSDDYQVVPMSSYLDIQGSNDIGATSATRINSYTIDQGCTVDYTICHSTESTTINNVVRSGDNITLGDGTYTPLALPSGISNLTLTGSGSNTIIDATGVSQGLTLNSVTNSSFSNLTIQNATIETVAYNMFSWAMRWNGSDYNTVSPTSLYAYSSTCNQNAFLTSPYTNLAGIDGIGTSTIGLFLLRIPDGAGPGVELFLTVFLPNSSGATPAEIETNCAQPQSIFQNYVSNAFILQPDSSYIYNASAVSAAGITPLGDGSNPFINRVVTPHAGIALIGSTNNAFSNITFSGNSDDIYLDSSSHNNTFTEMAFDASESSIASITPGTNSLYDSTLDTSSTQMTNGGLNIYKSITAQISDTSDASAVENALITIYNAQGATLGTLTTDNSGTASGAVLIGSITNSGTINNNPITFRVTADGYLAHTSSTTINAPYSLAIALTPGIDPSTTVSSGSSGNSGGFACNNCISLTIPPSTTARPLTPTTPLTPPTTPRTVNVKALTRLPNLKSGTTHRGVRELQRFLNQQGYTIALTGPGSPGNETFKFGTLTRKALARFQYDNGIRPARGYFGSVTRTFLKTLSDKN